MNFLKRSKLWSVLVLLASIGCVASVLYAILGVRNGWESMGYRDALGLMWQTSLVGIGVAICALAVLVCSRRGWIPRVVSALALLLVLVPTVAIQVVLDAPAGPPPSAANGAPATGMGAPIEGMAAAASVQPVASGPLNDISTDTVNPPQYNAVAAVRPEGSNTLEYPGARAAAIQAAQFPDIAPIHTSLSKAEAFARALVLVDKKGWELIAQDPNSGIIEAVSSTLVFSFEDDVVIRVRELGTGSVVDIRSHSRVGRGDQGVNAARVRDFIASF